MVARRRHAEGGAPVGTLDDLRRNWNILAETDAMWAVLTDPKKASRQWDADTFLATGEREVERVLDRVASKGVGVDMTGEALDFGCGAGRLTQALAGRFARAHGVDIAEAMVEAARAISRRSNAMYHVNAAADLSLFDYAAFAFVYTSIVLQHMEPPYMERYVAEFLRVLRPGGVLVFQVPDREKKAALPARARENARRLVSRARVRLGLGERLRRLRGAPAQRAHETRGEMEMHAVPEAEIRAWVARGGGQVVDVALTNSTALDFNGELRYLDEEPESGWISKQYTVVKFGG